MTQDLFVRAGLIATASALLAMTVAAQQPAVRVRVVLPAFRNAIAIDTVMLVTDHEVSAGALWAAAARVFYDYKMPTDLRDSVGGVVGTTRYVKSTYMQNFPMSKVLNCGTSITGPNADNYRISHVLVAIISPVSAAKSKLGVGYVASGLDMRGSSSDPVACGSTGNFEADFADRVKKLLKAGS